MKVLLVDDERRLVDALRRGLTAEGFDVEVAFDGLTGQALAERGYFDAIILDIMMPGKNGFEVCSSLRAAGVNTPILMLTAKDGQLDEARALNIGADDYLTKPFHYVVLVARLKALLRRAGRTSNEEYEGAGEGTRLGGVTGEPLEQLVVGDLKVLPTAQRVFRGDVEVHLTAKEFAILTYLVRHVNQVVSKERLIDELWDFAAPADPNVVEVHISSLRRKIDTPFSKRSIRTVRGVGYRLEEG